MLTAKEYLENVRESMEREEMLRERLARARVKYDGVGAIQYDDMPKNPNASDAGIHNAVIAYMRIVETLEEQAAFTEMLIEQAFAMFERMRDDGIDKALCDEAELYYLWDMETDEISQQLKPHRATSTLNHRRVRFLELADAYVPLDAA